MGAYRGEAECLRVSVSIPLNGCTLKLPGEATHAGQFEG